MNFQYSGGLLGYGAKGPDGSLGLQGLALYFTNYDPVFNLLAIEDAIRNDYVLWSTAEPGTKLPGGRKYQSGDLFVTSRGYIYEIDAEADEFHSTIGALSKSNFFATRNIPAAEGFIRFFNIYDASVRYIIDNNFSEKTDYLFPSSIYGILIKDFARIEYTDVSAFTLYSCAESAMNDDHKVIALVRSEDGFHFGNIEGNIRNTNLILDVSILQANRETPITINTPSQTLITSSEKDTNLLFDPNFAVFQEIGHTISNPPSFRVRCNGESSYIDWDLQDFSLDSSIKGSIIFAQETPLAGTWRIDSSIFQPLVFYDVAPSGTILLTDLSIGTRYQCYMVIEKDGWERRSEVISFEQTGSATYMLILDPASKTLTADSSGWFPTEISPNKYQYHVDISTNSVTGWNVDPGSLPSWITVQNGSGPSGTHVFDVSLLKNTGSSSRTGNINILSEAATETIAVTQNVYQTWAYFGPDGSLMFSPPLTDQYASVTIKLYTWVRVQRHYLSGSRTVRGQIDLTQGATVKGSSYIERTAHNNTRDASSNSAGPEYPITSTIYPNYSNAHTFKVDDITLECAYDNDGDYEFSQVWAEITDAHITSGTGRIDISTNRKVWYAKNPINSSPRCTRSMGVAASVPAMPPFV